MRKLIAISIFLIFIAIPANTQNTPHSITLSWVEAQVGTTFNIYRGTVTGGPYVKIASGVSTLSYVDTSGTGGTLYFYVVTAVDSQSDESVYSNEVSGTFRENPPPPALAAPVVK